MAGIGKQIWRRFSRRYKYEQWTQAADRLGLAVSDFSWMGQYRLSGFVNGLEVEVLATNTQDGQGPTMTYYRVGITGDYETPELTEEEVRKERMRLHASPTVKELWNLYPEAAVVGNAMVGDAIVGVEQYIANDADTIVKTVQDLTGFVKALRAESGRVQRRATRKEQARHRYQQWQEAARELGLSFEGDGLRGTSRGLPVRVRQMLLRKDNPQGVNTYPHVTVEVGSSAASVISGWKFHAQDGLAPGGIRIALPPPPGSDPTGAFLGDPDRRSQDPSATVHMVVSGRDRKRFVEHLNDYRKDALWSLFHEATTRIENGTIRCRFDQLLGTDSHQIAQRVNGVIDKAIILNG